MALITLPTPSTSVAFDEGLITYNSGEAVNASAYQSGRDNDGTNQFHTNVPTGASMEWSINDVAHLGLAAGGLTSTLLAAGRVYIDGTSTANTGTAGILDVNVTSLTNNSSAADIAAANTATTGNTAYSLKSAITSSAVVTGTSQNLYGSITAATKTGADTSVATTTLYGLYSSASNTGATDAGTKNTYAGYFTATGDTAGTATAYGLYATASGADTNYGLYVNAGLTQLNGAATITNVAGTTGNVALTVNQGAHTAITANMPSINIPTVSLAIASGSTITIGSLVHLAAQTYTGVAGGGAETISDAATLYISGAPVQGANAVLTRTHALWVDDGIVRFDSTLNASGGGALTGTWSDLGSVTTVDINGGSVDGATVGTASASTGKFTTLEATGLLTLSTTAAITASTTQTQGNGALTTTVNEVSVCANANDTVTLPAAAAGVIIHIFNNGANTLQVFPASGDAIDGGAANASVTMTAGSNHTFIAHDATNWNRLNSAL